MNNTTISGNLTRDPEIKYLGDGAAKAEFGVAVNRRWQDRQTGEWVESTSFFNVVAWRDLAENIVLSLSKGSRVVVSGRLEQRSWTDDNDRVRSQVEIVADDVAVSLRFSSLTMGEQSESEYA